MPKELKSLHTPTNYLCVTSVLDIRSKLDACFIWLHSLSSFICSELFIECLLCAKNCSGHCILSFFLLTSPDMSFPAFLAIHTSDSHRMSGFLLHGNNSFPSVYSPSVNPDLAKKRQYHVINAMLNYGYITKEEAISIK